MKKIITIAVLCFCAQAFSEQSRTLSDITIEELTEIVREIIQESLEKCMVKGSMQGRAKVNLAVVGSVEAQMYCNFEKVVNHSDISREEEPLK
tara:strand:- start:2364 stop:2642 length:279 start_codon:yes stop_codon:yes gene_type:complete